MDPLGAASLKGPFCYRSGDYGYRPPPLGLPINYEKNRIIRETNPPFTNNPFNQVEGTARMSGDVVGGFGNMWSMDWKKTGVKALISGVTGAALATFVFGEGANTPVPVPIVQTSISAPMMVGLSTAGGTVAADVLEKPISRALPSTSITCPAVRATISGATTAFLLSGSGAAPGTYLNAAVTGAVSDAAGTYGTNMMYNSGKFSDIW